MKPRTYTALPSRLWLSNIAVIIFTSAHRLAQDGGPEWLTALLAIAEAMAVIAMFTLVIIDRNRIWAVYVRFKKHPTHDKGGSK
ncbi:MAG: hypothetical protein E7L06_08330 [Schaalia turicensis]|nr:hypothetical protein [Schaalia turicensis]